MTDRRAPLISRLSPPLSPAFEIERTQVSEQIFSAGGARLVLICMAAGFGKTTVMRQVRQRCEVSGVASGWLHLEASDNDISRLLAGLSAALENVMPGISAEGAADLDNTAEPSAVTLLERVARHREAFVLFLDDFEVIHSASVLNLIRQFIRVLPAGAQLVIGSRVMPDLGLGRLRASGHLLEIEPAQLRFSLEETGTFLRSARGLDLTAEQVSHLHARTEGWAAALWLASLALVERARAAGAQDKEAPTDFIVRFSGSEAAIADYLAEDVLSHQDADVRDFLLRTSILASLSPEICDAICGTVGKADEMLQRLSRANLFVIPLDNQRSEFRYHGLFSEFLRGQLRREMPKEVPRLHKAASAWYQAHARPVPAIEHALLADDLELALPMLARQASQLLSDARMRLLARWLGGVPAARLAAYPDLQIIHAWAVNFTSGPHDAMALLESFDSIDQLSDESLAQLLTLKLLLLLRMDRIDEAYQLGIDYLKKLPIEAGFARSMFANALGTASMMRGQFEEAQSQLIEARRVQAPTGGSFSVVISESVEGAIDLLRGHLQQAISRLRGAIEPRASGPARYSKANALAGILLAEALYEVDQRVESERLLTGYLSLIQEGGIPDQLISGHILLARLLALRGDHDQSFHMLMELEYVGHRIRLARVVASARLERARMALAAGKADLATEELQFSADAPMWSDATQHFMVANDVDNFELMKLRLSLRSGRTGETIAPLSALLALAEGARRQRRALKIKLLLAEALQRDGQGRIAQRVLGEALEFGRQEGFIRSFADEGAELMRMVREFADSGAAAGKAIPRDYIERILLAGGAGGVAAPPAEASDLAESLTKKEIAVLQLVADGLSNRSLAQKLFVSETTVRTHLRNINAKLGVHSRVQAIVVARRHGYVR